VLLGIYLVGILTLRIVTVQSFRQFMPPARRT